MEYGINFNNDEASKAIFTALEDLDNTFFAEYSDYEYEKEPSSTPNSDESDNDEVTLDFDDNTYLNNFEFKENSDSYIEDEIYDHLKLKVKEFFEKKSVHAVLLINLVL